MHCFTHVTAVKRESKEKRCQEPFSATLSKNLPSATQIRIGSLSRRGEYLIGF